MRLSVFAVLPLALAACGPDQGSFQVEYNTLLCNHMLECGDQAELTFDGILTQEDCESTTITEVQEWGAGCRFVGGNAEQCLLDMSTLTCPSEEGTLADRPASCDAVFIDCPIGSTDDDGSDDESSGDDDAADSDTDAA